MLQTTDKFTLFGETKTAREWAEIFCLPIETVRNRMNQGADFEGAVRLPTKSSLAKRRARGDFE